MTRQPKLLTTSSKVTLLPRLGAGSRLTAWSVSRIGACLVSSLCHQPDVTTVAGNVKKCLLLSLSFPRRYCTFAPRDRLSCQHKDFAKWRAIDKIPWENFP